MGTITVGKMSSSNASRKSRNTKTNNSNLLVCVNFVAVMTALFSTYCFMFEPVTLKPLPQKEHSFDKVGLAQNNNNNNNSSINGNETDTFAVPTETFSVPTDDFYDDDSDADDQIFHSFEYDEEDDDGFLSGGNETRTLASFWESFRYSALGRTDHQEATETTSFLRKTARAPP